MEAYTYPDTVTIKTKLLTDTAKLPTRGSAYAAGSDLYADITGTESIILFPNETVMFNTGICVEIPVGYFGAIFARSGLATKEGLRPANCVGVVDSDYRGEVMVALHNDSEKVRHVSPGDRIAQLVILPYAPATFCIEEDLSETDRGEGGFGSTGT